MLVISVSTRYYPSVSPLPYIAKLNITEATCSRNNYQKLSQEESSYHFYNALVTTNCWINDADSGNVKVILASIDNFLVVKATIQF